MVARLMTDAPNPAKTGPSESAQLLRERSYMMYLATRFFSTCGVQTQLTVITWQIYGIAREVYGINGEDPVLAIKKGALALSMIGLIQFLPLLVLAPIAGQFADRHDRKRILQATIAIDIVAAIALAVVEAIKPSMLPIFIIAGVFGVSRAFMMPAASAMAPMLVPRPLMPRALAWSSLSFQSGLIMGPALAGLIIAISPTAGYGAACIFYLLALICVSGITKPTRPEQTEASRWAMIKEGLIYVWRQKIVLGSISLDLFAVLLGGVTLLLPVFALDILHVGPEGYGLLRATPGIGAAIVAMWLAAHPIKRHAGPIMLWSVALFAVATMVFGAAKPIADALGLPQIAFSLTLVALAVVWGADMISVYVRQTLVQIVTPDNMRGRVAAVSSLFISASNELGEFESGLVARFLGPVGAAMFGGIGALLVTGTWAVIFPDLRKADKLTGD